MTIFKKHYVKIARGLWSPRWILRDRKLFSEPPLPPNSTSITCLFPLHPLFPRDVSFKFRIKTGYIHAARRKNWSDRRARSRGKNFTFPFPDSGNRKRAQIRQSRSYETNLGNAPRPSRARDNNAPKLGYRWRAKPGVSVCTRAARHARKFRLLLSY